jgi:F-box domain
MAASPNLHPFRLLELPLEIILHILSFFNLPSLETFRQTSRFCRTIPSPSLLSHAEERYRFALFQKERKDASEREALGQARMHLYRRRHYAVNPGEFLGCYISVLTQADLHQNPLTRADRLHCFTCYRYLDRDRFTKSQRTRKRSYGHPDTMKRFCISCGFKQKWSHATEFKGGTLPCFACRRIAPTSFEAKKLDLCLECFRIRGRELRQREAESQRDDAEDPDTIDEWPVDNVVQDNVGGMSYARSPAGYQKLGYGNTGLPSEFSWESETPTCLRDDDTAAVPSAVVTSKRAERCTRCWMINHTFQPAVVISDRADRFCGSCWTTRQD